MLVKHLNTLELPKILEQLVKECSFSVSIELARALFPSADATIVARRLAETTEARQALTVNDTLGIGGARDIRDMVMRAGRGGMMEPIELLDVRETLHSARNVQRAVSRYADTYPQLNELVILIEPQVELVEDIARCIDDRGEVRDGASPELRKIRSEVRIAHDRLMQKLQHLLGSSSTYLQESLVTQRGGRYVLPVKADFRGRIPGIVHDQSASGLTLFIEPLATLALNNTWRELQLAEQREIWRILTMLSNQVGALRDSILRTVEQLALFDLALAKAKYADRLHARPAKLRMENKKLKIEDAAQFSISQARHPLLAPEIVVPIDITLDATTRVLVITGPNTGGKTVAMKTVGLLAMMTQCGLHIPVDDATLPIFEAVYADIGDEQSIEQSLSTFSAHLTNLVSFLGKVDAHSLVLMDELGSGTDPHEGAALARATLDYLLASGAICVVATHYAELKSWAAVTEGVSNANVAFDVKTLRPLYKLTIGLPGKSNAFAIAQRLGLPQVILDDAVQHLTGEHMKAEDMLAEIEKMRRQTEAARNAARRAERVAEDNADKLRIQLRHIDDERQKVLAQAREDAEKEIELLRAEVRRLRGRVVAAGESLDEVREIERELSSTQDFADEERKIREAVAEKRQEARAKSQEPRIQTTELRQAGDEPRTGNAAAPKPKTQNLKSKIGVGDTVRVKALDSLAIVASVSDDGAEVQIGRMRMKVKLRDVERVKAPDPGPVDNSTKYERGYVDVSPGMELDMRGMMAEEGVDRVQDYLERASRAGLPFVRIIHGKGTGVLRRAVREAIKDHSAVKSFETGLDGEGGDGVTVVKLHANG